MNLSDAREAMIARLVAAVHDNFGTVPLLVEPEVIAPMTVQATPLDTTKFYVRAISFANQQRAAAFNKRLRTNGIFYANVLCPVRFDNARTSVGKLADLIAAAFAGKQDTNELFYRTALVREQPEENNRFNLRVEVAFDLTTRN
jgi:hypothetical protein